MDRLELDRRIYALVESIPCGKVATYGELAYLAGVPRCARQVGRVLHFAPPEVPCHRVVNHAGGLAPGFSEQRARLSAEGVRFTRSGNVDLKHFLARAEEPSFREACRAIMRRAEKESL